MANNLIPDNSMKPSGGGRFYRLTVRGFSGGLNELLNGVYYDPKKRRIVNRTKAMYERICIETIRFDCPELRRVLIKTPIVIHYKFYMKDKRHDRMNVGSAFDKAFCDALQKTGNLLNDGWNEILGCTFDYAVDAKNPRVEIVIIETDHEPVMWRGWERIENGE